MTTNQPQFGERLRTLRQAAELTQDGLAAATGVKQTTISMIETGKWRPRIDTAVAIARALGVTLDTLCAVEPPPEKIKMDSEPKKKRAKV